MKYDALRESFAKTVLGSKGYRHWVLERLYELQTPSEQAKKVTLNSAGFTAPDASILSGLAEKFASGGTLTMPEEMLLT